ncbi:MAG: response regulator transcription factor [Bryobacteraceae bacterium]|nr:response regulator transcription factor [Bryobacteraceae bacterium]
MQPALPIRVMIVDDHPVVREGLQAMLSAEPDIDVVGEAGTAAEAIARFQSLRPKIVVMDLMLPDRPGSEAIADICAQSPDTFIVVLTSLGGDAEIYRALDAGVRAYLFKETARAELVRAIRAVNAGNQYIPAQVGLRLAEHLPRIQLTGRELEVLKRVALGRRNKEIAFELDVSDATVAAHVKHILKKLDVNDRTEAVTVALKRGLITL